jgi:predicted component of type VI protein secretion system
MIPYQGLPDDGFSPLRVHLMGPTNLPVAAPGGRVPRLLSLDEGPDILLDRAMLVVGRHPQCDARLDSIRISRRHCCMMYDRDTGVVIIRDLGSTNGVRINGQRVEMGKLRVGDELSIAHIRYRLEMVKGSEEMLEETMQAPGRSLADVHAPTGLSREPDHPLAAAVRDILPPAMADRCQIHVIVQVAPDVPSDQSDEAPKSDEPACQPGLSHSPPA